MNNFILMSDYKIINLKQIDSTNTYAKDNLALFHDRTVVCAETQTGGRGRFKRAWHSSNSGNIYASIVLKPRVKDINALPITNLTQYLCVIISDILKTYGIDGKIKWPNDIQVNKKKISGILAENKIDDEGYVNIILGVGVNLNLSKEEVDAIDQPATSLNLELNKEISKDEFLKLLLDAFFAEYDEFLNKGFLYIKSRFVQKCAFLGSEILIKNLDSKISGIAKGINDDGSLRLSVTTQCYQNSNKQDVKDSNKDMKIFVGDVIC